MAEVIIAVHRGAISNTTGNQTFTLTSSEHTGKDFTPKAAMFIATSAVSDDTEAVNAVLSIGVTDGTFDGYMHANAEDNQTASDCTRSKDETACMGFLSPGSGTVAGEATFVSFGTNAVTISWDDAPTVASLMTVILFGGDDLEADTGAWAAVTADVDVAVTGVGFKPDILFNLSNSKAIEGSSNDFSISLGIAIRDADESVSSCAARMYVDDAEAVTTDARIRVDPGCIGQQGGGGDLYELKSFDSDGFTATPRFAGTERSIYLALKIGNASKSLQIIRPPYAVEDVAYDVGFRPNFLFGMLPRVHRYGFSSASGLADRTAVLGLGVATPDAAYANYVRSVDDITLGNTDDASFAVGGTGASGVFLEVSNDDGTASAGDGYKADVTSFDVRGYTLGWARVDNLEDTLVVLAVGGNPDRSGDIEGNMQ